ncbi:NADPH-dependent FMN reductase [Salibacterium qingdaonense]|uniref:NAD(P)H-dependent FMN reductase n=1 Tax=Salibacterium qingdaonense TaxID=266892 RepID=A0A1I4IKV7_9BACI|nr:NADPH-dependent FMN reductase [Salibacterium qingdaonense]SFL54905.1 NAD(P)H-dependent FMN reductase [Salibacterium qingdaonense]
MTTDNKNIVGIAGSLRQNSFNRSILREMSQHPPEGMDISIFNLKHIPLFNADLEENGDPEAVEDFKDAVKEADGFLIVTPEYSHGMPGVLKNALDWAASVSNRNVLDEKPVYVLGASPTPLGTAFSQAQVKQTLAAAGSFVLQQPELYIGKVPNKLDETGELQDERTKTKLYEALEAFDKWIDTMNSAT